MGERMNPTASRNEFFSGEERDGFSEVSLGARDEEGTRKSFHDVHGKVLSLRTWFLKSDHHETKPDSAGTNEEASENPEILMVGSATIANANSDDRPSQTATFSRVIGESRPHNRRRRVTQILGGVFVGGLAVVACTIGVLWASGEPKEGKEGATESPVASGSGALAVGERRGGDAINVHHNDSTTYTSQLPHGNPEIEDIAQTNQPSNPTTSATTTTKTTTTTSGADAREHPDLRPDLRSDLRQDVRPDLRPGISVEKHIPNIPTGHRGSEPGGDVNQGHHNNSLTSSGGGGAREYPAFRPGMSPVDFPCHSHDLCEATGSCVDVIKSNGSLSHLCICQAGFRGDRCQENICDTKPCVGDEVCELSTHGILRCRQVDACRFQISSKNKRTADLNLKNSTTSKKNSTTSQKNLTTSQKNLTTSPTPNATSPSTTSVHGLNTCLNDATCIPFAVEFQGQKSKFACLCKKFYYGLHCEEKLEEVKEREGRAMPMARPLPCVDAHCDNNGTCINLNTEEFKCVCPTEFGGSKCKKRLSPCEIKKCLNGGSCAEADKKASCTCAHKFHGEVCQYRNGCYDKPCHDGSTCSPFADNKFTCRCTPQFMGELCDILNPCFSQPCQNHGICRLKTSEGKGVLSYRCSCDTQKFVGRNCERVSPCSSSPCQNGGTCQPETKKGQDGKTTETFRCYCDWQKHVGDRCDVISACQTSPCLNGAKCLPKMDGTTRECQCMPGFTGENCDINFGG